ncbi:hypothetical protein BRD00_11860 [Halobacteriales archaeon QS_8_69_26]|nr:MAG: hypothetical protein BRD00_11860 [Halobacteriales archaeon QS_8_69_26]
MTDDRPVEQYANESNLSTRGSFNQRFSTREGHPHDWAFGFVRDALPGDADVLELGCGTGSIWRRNADRTPPGWTATLTDFSQGMVQAARGNLAGVDRTFDYATAAAAAIPVRDGAADAVLANMMLYHVPDRDVAFREINRILRPDGYLFAMTVTRDSKATLYGMLDEAATGEGSVESLNREFTLSDGGAELREHFDSVESHRFESPLSVTDADALVEYARTLPDHPRLAPFDESDLPALRRIAQRRLEDGPIRMRSDLGLFVARR